MVNIIEVETDNGIYKLKQPVGLMAIKQVSISTKYGITNPKFDVDEEGNKIILYSQRDQEKLAEFFEKWAEQILPNILLEGNPYPYEEMPPEDMMDCFAAVTQYKSSKSFRGN